jgi:predicted nucleic acid-binding protein
VTARPDLSGRIAEHDLVPFVTDLEHNAVLIDDPQTARYIPLDPDDDYLVALALAAGAHVIVTGDSALLGLGLGLESPRILSPRDFLTALGRSDA